METERSRAESTIKAAWSVVQEAGGKYHRGRARQVRKIICKGNLVGLPLRFMRHGRKHRTQYTETVFCRPFLIFGFPGRRIRFQYFSRVWFSMDSLRIS